MKPDSEAKTDSFWRVLAARIPRNRFALRFLMVLGVLAVAYFPATLELKLTDSGSAERPLFVAAIAEANQWVRRTLLEPYQRSIAGVSAALLGALGHEAEARGREIHSRGFAVAITSGCDAIEPSLLFCAAILCFPAAAWMKLAGLLAGVVAIAALNVVRVVTLWLIGVHGRWAFDTVHFTIWPFVIILFTAAAFLLWLNWAAVKRSA